MVVQVVEPSRDVGRSVEVIWDIGIGVKGTVVNNLRHGG